MSVVEISELPRCRLHHRSGLISAIMCAGGVLAYLVLIPMISFFGQTCRSARARSDDADADMGPGPIRNAYVLYIGAGAVAVGGLMSVFRSLPTIWHGMQGWSSRFQRVKAEGPPVTLRTDRDLSMRIVLIGIMALVLAIAFRHPALHRWHVEYRRILPRRSDHRDLRFPLRDRLLAAHGRNRLVVEPISA